MDWTGKSIEMIRYCRSIAIGSYIDEAETLADITRIRKGFENAGGCWKSTDIELSLMSHEHNPYSIPNEITKALIKLFQSIASARSRSLSLQSSDPPATDCTDDGNRQSDAKRRRLFLEIDPTIRDDANFRNILEAATDALALQDLKINGYGNFYPFGSIGYSTSEQFHLNQHHGPSLWETIRSSDSLQNIHVSVHGPDEGSEEINCFSTKTSGFPRLWEAIQCNNSLASLAVHLHCHVCEQQENEDEITMLQRNEAISTMKSILETLKDHSTIRKLDLRYKYRDENLRTLLIPHVTDILKRSSLNEFRLERFSFYSTADRTAFPVNEFIEALSKGMVNRSMGGTSCNLSQSKEKLEVLRLCNVGLTDVQASELLRHLPNHMKILDLSKNALVGFPVAINDHNSSELQELNLWKNPCLYNHDQETSMKFLLSLLLKYPCLKDFGPWDKWQFQTQVPHSSIKPGNSACNSSSCDVQLPMDRLVEEIDLIADQNRCKARLFPRNKVLFANPSFWPIVLSQTKDPITQSGQKRRKRLLGESSKHKTERQANVIFSILRHNFFGGAIPVV